MYKLSTWAVHENNEKHSILAKAYLTDQLVRSASCATGKSQEIICDCPSDLDGKIRNGSIAGLGLRVTAQGAKSFVHTFRYNGKFKRHVIGTPANLNVASARLKVQQRSLEIEQGIDPSAHQQVDFRKKHGKTLGEIIDAYVEQRLSETSQKNQDEFASLVAPWTRVPPKNPHRGGTRKKRVTFGDKLQDELVDNIKPSDIAPFIAAISSNHVANKTLRHLKSLFNWAIRMQIIDMRNPCDPFRMRKIVKQRRDYTPDQVREIAKLVFNPPMPRVVNLSGLKGEEKRLAALEAGRATVEHEQMLEFCAFMGILFLTMARPAELKNARFDHFDLDRLIWHKHNTKGIKLSRATYEYAFRSVPIHPKVADLVRSQRIRWQESNLLFPNHSDQTQPRDNFKRGLKRFKELEGIPSYFQLYDLKRMAISMMISGAGVRRDAVSHLADHRGNIETTLLYDLGMVDPLRPVTERLGQILGVE
ncbi:tyrosine-type recombinase/integrase [Aliiroseovarius sp.]|uniref:tyrosine-type recombinase/integrase n=1 Tax=Aliiroseovarius sp. TaxID=1872442 RepID=UPI003BA9D534